MSDEKKVSIIIRTRNEERWIAHCLREVCGQDHKNYEVILVDNESTDHTIEKAKQFPLKKVVTCRDYLPGKALNLGIREASGDYVVCLSGHCIPVNSKWLSSLLANFSDPDVAGVYGRQEPMTFTSDADKRDLALVFGLDRRVQIKDNFFHNANSMIRREVWDRIPFDETVTNIEDRAWAKKVLEEGRRIVYEPLASVYHHHGIHQNGNEERCTNVVRIMESLHKDYKYKTVDLERMNVVAMIPVRGEVKYLNGKPLLAYTIKRARESKYIKHIIVSTDSPEMAEIAKKLGAEVPFLREPALSEGHVDLSKVFKYSIERIEAASIFPDYVVCLEITFPFRRKGLIDDMIEELAENGFDSVVAARVENKAIWQEDEGDIRPLVEGMTPRQYKEPTFVELKGVGCVTHPEFLRKGEFLGQKIGIYQVDSPYSHLEVRSEEDIKMASLLADSWFLRE